MNFITSEEELKLIHRQGLYFYANWMPFHKKMVATIEKVEKEYEFPFIAIDVDTFKSFVKRFDIKCIPTVIIYNKNRENTRFSGLILLSAFRSILNNLKEKQCKKNKKLQQVQ